MKILFASWLLLLSISVCGQKPRLVIPLGHESPISRIIVSPDEKKLVTFEELSCYVWDVSTGKLLFVLGGHTDRIKNAAFSNDGKLIATSSYDRTVKVWNALTGELLYDLTGHQNIVHGVCFTVSGKQLISGGGTTVKIWDMGTGKLIRDLNMHRSYVTSVACSDDGKYIFSGSDDSTISVIDANSFKLIRSLKGHQYYLSSILPAPAGKLISIDLNGQCIVWDVNSGRQLLNINDPSCFINSAELFTGGTALFVGTSDSRLIGYRLNDRKKLFEYKTGFPFDTSGSVKYLTGISRIIPMQNGKRFGITGYNDTLMIFDPYKVKPSVTIKHPENISYAKYLPKSDQLVTAGVKMTIWNALKGYELVNIQSHALPVSLIGVSASSGKMTLNIDGNCFGSSMYTNEISPIAGKVLAVSPEQSLQVVASNDIAMLYRDGIMQKSIVPVPGKEIWYAQFSMDGKYALLQYNSENTVLVQLDGWKTFVLHQRMADKGTFNNKGSRVVTFGLNDSLIMWNTSDASKQLIYNNQSLLAISSAAFSSNDRYVAFCASPRKGYGDTLFLLSLPDMKIVHRIPLTSNYNFTLKFSNDDKYIILSPHQGYLQCYDVASGNLLYKLDGLLVNKTYSNNIDIMALGYADEKLRLHDISTGKQLLELNGHKSIVTDAFFDVINNRIITGSEDKSIRSWDLTSGKLNYTVFAMNNSLVTVTPDGYFKASPAACRNMHYVTADAKVITFDQLDIQNNRPDKVLQVLGSKDTALINSYQMAYVKRLKKFGIDSGLFKNNYEIPELTIVNRSDINYDQANGKLVLKINAGDKRSVLIRFNVWVNEVPVFGSAGINIAGKNSNVFDTTLSINLSAGLNRVEVSVTNEMGIESYRTPILVKYNVADSKPGKLHFIGIGINRYQDSTRNLNWSVKDIRDLVLKLRSKYPSMIVDTLFDDNVTKEKVLALKDKLGGLGEEDKLIIAFSGHGLLSRNLDYYLSTSDINFNKPEEKALSYDAFEGLADNIKPRKKLLLIDACHSGEVDKEDIEKIEGATTVLDSLGTNTRSTIKITSSKKVGLTNSFELMQNLFVNVSRGTGATVISAAGGMQFAQERGDLKNGVFTYSILDAFNKNSTLTVSQLKTIVSDSVFKLTGGLQKPTCRTETNTYDWVIW